MVVPDRCKRVAECLRGQRGFPPFVKANKHWRYLDIILVTGHQCDDRKLRQLRELNPNSIAVRTFKGKDGTTYRGFRLKGVKAA